MKLREQYDWIVLGDHPGALLSAGLAARLGLSVLVLPLSPSRALVMSKGEKGEKGERFVDLESNFIAGLGRVPRFSGLLSECLGRIGITPAELEQVRARQPLPQILTPELRVDFGAPWGLGLELERELGKAKAARLGWVPALERAEADLLSFWLHLPDRLTLAPGRKRPLMAGQRAATSVSETRRKSAREASDPAQARWLSSGVTAGTLERQQSAPGLRSLSRGLWAGVGAGEARDPLLPALLQLMALGRTGASFRGGVSAYRELLLGIARRLGAHVPAKVECKRIFVEKGRFIGVQVSTQANSITGHGAMVGCALAHVEPLVTAGGRTLLRKLKRSPQPSAWNFTIALTVRDEGIPPGATPRMVWQEDEAPALEIELRDPAEHGLRKPGHQTVLARARLPFAPESLQPAYQRLVAARMLRQVSRLLPFADRHVTEVYPEFRKGSDSELREVYGFASLEEIPGNLRVLSSESARGAGSRSGYEGLFVATDESFPDLGGFGATVAALESVSWLAHRSGLAGPFA